jgi:hypothetical protein
MQTPRRTFVVIKLKRPLGKVRIDNIVNYKTMSVKEKIFILFCGLLFEHRRGFVRVLKGKIFSLQDLFLHARAYLLLLIQKRRKIN